MLDPTAYTRDFVESGGEAVEGTTVFINFTPFEEASSNKELQLYEGLFHETLNEPEQDEVMDDAVAEIAERISG